MSAPDQQLLVAKLNQISASARQSNLEAVRALILPMKTDEVRIRAALAAMLQCLHAVIPSFGFSFVLLVNELALVG